MCVSSFNFPLRLPTLTILQFSHWLLVSPRHTPLIRGKLPLANRIHAKSKMRCGRLCSVSHHKAVVYCCLISFLLRKPQAINWNLDLRLSAYWRSVCDTRLLVSPLQWHNRVLINNLTLGNWNASCKQQGQPRPTDVINRWPLLTLLFHCVKSKNNKITAFSGLLKCFFICCKRLTKLPNFLFVLFLHIQMTRFAISKGSINISDTGLVKSFILEKLKACSYSIIICEN